MSYLNVGGKFSGPSSKSINISSSFFAFLSFNNIKYRIRNIKFVIILKTTVKEAICERGNIVEIIKSLIGNLFQLLSMNKKLYLQLQHHQTSNKLPTSLDNVSRILMLLLLIFSRCTVQNNIQYSKTIKLT